MVTDEGGGLTIKSADKEMERRAYLLASAPELYKALGTMNRWVNEGGHNGHNEGINEICLMAERALRKARGES